MSNVVVPQLGESVVEARIAKWLKQPGDRVNTGDALVSLETDKVDVEVPADHAGVLVSIAHAEGADVKVGEVIGVLEAGDGPVAATPAAAPTRAAAASTAPAPEAAKAAETRATPTARRMAETHQVKLDAVPGTGSAGRVTKADVTQAIAPVASPEPPAPKPPPPRPAAAPVRAPAVPGSRTEERVRMTKRRATIARRLVEAQRTAAMLTTFNEADMTAVMALRERHKAAFKEQHGVGLGLTSFFVKATISALRAFPLVNAEIQGDEIVYKHYYDIGIAVGAEGGLVVPVLRDADHMSFGGIETATRDFATRAGNGTLSLADITGGTFTITNGGVFGSMMSTPILNPPQVGILGLHKIADRPVAVNGQVVVRPMMYLALSYDHRIVDGREAVQFLVRVKACIEDPGQLLLEG
ncbi:MAG: 2-oxoglutarate dehydrogenase complex dihydrolipoyllysine-residue succinyltransferase [Vicinamibacterales bacterium]